jgi:hypothetical protein
MIMGEMMEQGAPPPAGEKPQGTAGEGNRLGPLPYIVASLSALPLLGLVFALIAIPWGLATYRRGGKAVAIIGALGAGTQFVVIGALAVFMFR